MERSLIVAPSVLSADFSDIRGALSSISESGTSWVHLDVMDGTFVPNITYGPKFIADMRPHSSLFFDAHLMVAEPSRYIEQFASAGCDCITIHTEACSDVGATLDLIRKCGKKCGLSIKPGTPVSEVEPYLDDIDLVLIMSVEPGFGGQGLIPSTLDKVRQLASERNGRRYLISIDGGVNAKTIADVYASGVDVIVTGSAFFKETDRSAFVKMMAAGGKKA